MKHKIHIRNIIIEYFFLLDKNINLFAFILSRFGVRDGVLRVAQDSNTDKNYRIAEKTHPGKSLEVKKILSHRKLLV